MKCANAGQDARRPADFKIGPPNLRPAASHHKATLYRLGVNEAQGLHLGAKHGFKPGRRHQKYLKLTAYGRHISKFNRWPGRAHGRLTTLPVLDNVR